MLCFGLVLGTDETPLLKRLQEKEARHGKLQRHSGKRKQEGAAQTMKFAGMATTLGACSNPRPLRLKVNNAVRKMTKQMVVGAGETYQSWRSQERRLPPLRQGSSRR